MTEILDIVNEQDEVTGQMERNQVHALGLIYRSVHVTFYTPKGQLILQRRSMTKALYPGRLTTTVSGHVESGVSYYETAIKETREETGITIDPHKLIDLGKIYFINPEHEGTRGNTMKGLYAYPFDGELSDLKIEDGEGDGFEVLSVDAYKQALAQNPSDFVLLLATKQGQQMVEAIEVLLP